jgi:hypothetical protein
MAITRSRLPVAIVAAKLSCSETYPPPFELPPSLLATVVGAPSSDTFRVLVMGG